MEGRPETDTAATNAIRRMFQPATVAVVGATERTGSVGAAITRNLVNTFDGETVPVNPNTESVFGVTALDSVHEAENVDLAIITVPADVALDVLEECGQSGIPNVVVISAGFSEVGENGVEREARLRSLADKFEFNLVGPNSLGIMSTPVGLNATFGPDHPLEGSVSLLSQSGAFITAVVDWAIANSIGFKDVVSLGNKAVLDETDFLEFWGDDEDTDVIVGYLEAIEDGRAFIDTARSVTPHTPVVLIKAGRTDAGARAASSHTGALAGSERAHSAGFRQSGILRAESVEDLIDAAHVLAGQPVPDRENVGIVTNAGGLGVIATDAVGSSAVSMARFSPETAETLRDALPGDAAVQNPLDVLGDADVDRFRTAIDIFLADDEIGSILVLAAPTAVLDFDTLAEYVVEAYRTHGLPIMTCLMGGERVRKPRRTLTEAGIPCYFDPERAVNGLDVLTRYNRVRDARWDRPATFDVDRAGAREILTSVEEREGNRLGIEAMGILECYGIPIPKSEIVDSADDAHAVAEEIGPPVAVKIVSPDIVHKTDMGGVEVDVSLGEVRDVYERLITRARNYQPDATILGVQVQEMVDLESGVETILGVNRDSQFGPVVLFGLGGIFVEVFEDTTVRIAPISRSEAEDMIEDIRAAPILHGARGRKPVATDKVAETLQRLSQLVVDFPAILELDINPLVARPESVRAIDVRLTVDPEEL